MTRTEVERMQDYESEYLALWTEGGSELDHRAYGLSPQVASAIQEKVERANPAPQPEVAS